MGFRDVVIADIRSVLEADELSDHLEESLIRAQVLIDKNAKGDFEFIEKLSSTYYGRLTLIQTYTPKWFSDSLYSTEVLDSILERLVAAIISSGDLSLRMPKYWQDRYNGENTAISFDSNQRALEKIEKMVSKDRVTSISN